MQRPRGAQDLGQIPEPPATHQAPRDPWVCRTHQVTQLSQPPAGRGDSLYKFTSARNRSEVNGLRLAISLLSDATFAGRRLRPSYFKICTKLVTLAKQAVTKFVYDVSAHANLLFELLDQDRDYPEGREHMGGS